MARTKQRLKTIAVLGLTLFAFATAYAVTFSKQIRCQLVRWSELKEVNPSLFVDPGMSREQAAQLPLMLAEAGQRVALFYGGVEARPVVIAGQDDRVIGKYARPGNRTATTYLYLGNAYIILGPDGLNTDVIAHELMHAELSERIGWARRQFKIPTWFDSGLAMQADYREGYSEQEWQRQTDGGKLAPQLSRLVTAGQFYTADFRVNYATAKHEVHRWFAMVGPQGFQTFLQRVRNEDFTGAYESVERESQAAGQGARRP